MKKWTRKLLSLNSRQTRALLAGIGVFILMGLFPPWHYVYVNEFGHRRSLPAGFAVITSPPRPLHADNWAGSHVSLKLLLAEWALALGATYWLVRALKARNEDELHPFDSYRKPAKEDDQHSAPEP